MATYAIGDIHGCLTALSTLVEAIELQQDDVLITLGDYGDRGPDSKGCINFLLDLKSKFQVFCLRGNHEVMMLKARHNEGDSLNWLRVGGLETLESYAASNMEGIPDSHWDFLNATLPCHETGTHIFVHAGLDPLVPMESQSEWDLYWDFFDGASPHFSGKTMICGHSSQKSGIPLSYGFATCIDTYAYGGGWLTCLDVATNHYLQANEKGELREDVIEVSGLDEME